MDLTPTRLMHELSDRSVAVDRLIVVNLSKRVGPHRRVLPKERLTGEVNLMERDTQLRRLPSGAAPADVPPGLVSAEDRHQEHALRGSLHQPENTNCSVPQPVDYPAFSHQPCEQRLVPHRVYDLPFNDAFIALDGSHETGVFVRNTIALGWAEMFSKRSSKARELVLLCGNGGTTHVTCFRLLKEALIVLSVHLGKTIRVAHHPFYTSKRGSM